MKTIKTERDIRLTHDCVGEFTVPDYLPEIEKLLSAECSVAPDGIYLKSGGASGITAEQSGEVAFGVIWQGGDAATPTGAVFRCDYDNAAALGVFPADATPRCRAVTTVDSVFCRVTGPRKLSLRARLSSRIIAFAEASLSAPSECESESVEVLTDRIDSAISVLGSSHDLYTSVDVAAPGTPLYCRGGIRVDSCAPSAPSECRLTGEILLTCFFAVDGGIASESASVPFDETVALDLHGDMSLESAVSCRGFGSVTSVSLREGETSAVADVTYDLFADVLLSSVGDAVRDAYSTSAVSHAEYRELDFSSALACASTSLSVNERTAISRTGRVELVTGSAAVESVRADKGKLRLSGSVTGTALIKTDGERENVPYTVPWSCEIPLAKDASACENPDYVADVSVLSASGRADGELSVSAELFVSVTATAPKRISILDALSVDGGKPEPEHFIRVCYPTAGEGAWEIAKRFRVPVSRVRSAENTDENGAPRRVVVI